MGGGGGPAVLEGGGGGKKKRVNMNDGRSSITIVVMGDEGVGKSSLISTFVSRHFSEMVPGVMTRVRLPPDTTTAAMMAPVGMGGGGGFDDTSPSSSSPSSSGGTSSSSSSRGFVTSIVDTQGGDAALLAALSAAGGGQHHHHHPTTSTHGGGGSSFSPSSSLTSLSKQQHSSRPSPTNSRSSNSNESHPSKLVDSTSSGGGGLRRVVSSMEVDVIVLVYDLDRNDTFFRLESHWLPLIERCFGEEIPVIIAGNKMDLRLNNAQNTLSTSTSPPAATGGGSGSRGGGMTGGGHGHGHAVETTTTTTSSSSLHSSHQTDRQRIVALLQRFKFVRQCIKCSAKTLFHVSEIFDRAQHAVLYPIRPLYDLKEDRLTDDCQRAFVRIFRMMDVDGDGLLSSSELKAFQNKCFRVWGPLLDENISGWKKILSKKASSRNKNATILSYHNDNDDDDGDGDGPSLIRDGKFTVAGFLAIFDIFMSKDRWEVPWQILRIFGYDDSLQLRIPSSVSLPSSSSSAGGGGMVDVVGGGGPSSKRRKKTLPPWVLSPSAVRFLASSFDQFDSDRDGFLSEIDILNIFSIIPEPSLPPWHPSRSSDVYRGCFSKPKLEQVMSSSSARGGGGSSPSLLLSADPSLSAGGITISSSGAGGGDLIVPAGAADAASEEGEGGGAATTSSSSDGGTTTSHHLLRRYHHPRFSFFDWMGYWNMSSVISPKATKVELYRLGHVESPGGGRDTKHHHNTRRKKKGSISPTVAQRPLKPSITIRAKVFGSSGCGKTALLNALCQLDGDQQPRNCLVTKETKVPFTVCTHVQFSEDDADIIFPASSTRNSGKHHQVPKGGGDNTRELVVHVVVTEVPQELAETADASSLTRDCDLVILAFDCTDLSSLTFILDLESRLLTDDMPRVLVGTKGDKEKSIPVTTTVGDPLDMEAGESDGRRLKEHVLEAAMARCKDLDIEPPLITSVGATGVSFGSTTSHCSRESILQHIVRCSSPDDDRNVPQGLLTLRSKPHALEKQRLKDAKRKKMMWISSMFGFGIIVVVGTVLWPKREKIPWIRDWFSTKRSASVQME